MSQFLRLLADPDKAPALADACAKFRRGEDDPRLFEVTDASFDAIPGKPFAYWVSAAVHRAFECLPSFEGDGRTVKIGMKTGDDFRFLRAWWETTGSFLPYAKGGATEAFYGDIPIYVNWKDRGAEVKQFVSQRMRQMFGNENYEFWISNEAYYGSPGITWSLRAARFCPRVMPANAIFSVRGYSAFVPHGLELASLALMNSSAFDYIFKSALGRFGFPEFIVGTLQKLPWRIGGGEDVSKLERLARRAWSLKRTLDTVEETSHAFLLPAALRAHLSEYDPTAIKAELARIQVEIDALAFYLYGFSEADHEAVRASNNAPAEGNADDNEGVDEDVDDQDGTAPTDQSAVLLSWAVGVAFGRFDWRLAVGERPAPSEPDPFDAPPTISPGMLPHGMDRFHGHPGFLVDDPGQPHDIARLVEEVLALVNASIPQDVRQWLQREFFPFHLQRYSKSRRKAPIYWPLSTASGSYTLWLYYPTLDSQTLYTAVNDFIDGPTGKLTLVRKDADNLREKGSARTNEDDRALETLQSFEQELLQLRDTLLQIAPIYHPHHDDGVQITAAPLWPLFRHKPWQKLLKETWGKLEKGDYDWAHLALAYWPDRVREKCKTDKSLAIAHDLQHLYVEPELTPPKTRGRRKKG